ncbi:MAG: hypothetical protein ABI456_10700 [Ktedonobacteraceae bacterium]
MPPISPELQLLLNRLLAEVDQLRASVVQMQKEGEQYVREGTFHERITDMKGDIDALRERLDSMEKTIIANQQMNYRRVITVQAAILSPFVVAVIGYITKMIFHW